MVLKFLSAGPDFYQEERYPAYHFIQLGKIDSFNIFSDGKRKDFVKFLENDIHYRRGIGIKIVLQGLEAAFKKGFRTYGGKTIFSSVMIAPAKTTPVATRAYLHTRYDIWTQELSNLVHRLRKDYARQDNMIEARVRFVLHKKQSM